MYDIYKYLVGIWLVNEDKQLYEIQIKSQGVKVRVHPSKVVTQNAPASSSLSKNVASTIASNISTSSETSDNSTSDCDCMLTVLSLHSKVRKTKQYSTRKIALHFVKQTSLSYPKSA